MLKQSICCDCSGSNGVDIAARLCVEPKSFTKMERYRINYQDPFEEVDDDELDWLVNEYTEDKPAVGETTIDSYLVDTSERIIFIAR